MRRGSLVASGLVVAALYAASAAWSGHLSPLARRPLLDGLVPPAPYRWVEPPPELAGTNLQPVRQTFLAELGNRGSLTAVFTTGDAQVTLILPKGAFGPAEDQERVRVEIAPLAPTEVTEPDGPSTIFGNVYRVSAEYASSGERARLRVEARVVLVYPAVAGHVGGHEILVSSDGGSWRGIDTNDLPSVFQADGPIRALGYVAVAGTTGSPTAAPGAHSGGSPVAVVAIVAGIVVLAVGAAVALRPSRPARGAARGSRPSRSRRTRRG